MRYLVFIFHSIEVSEVIYFLPSIVISYAIIQQDEKDRRIRELTLELSNERQKCRRQCAAYQERLHAVLKDIEQHTDHLSRRVQDIVQHIKEIENDHQIEDSDC